LSSEGIPVICGCGLLACRLPSPEYDSVTLLEVCCPHCKAINVVTTSHGRIAERLYKGVLKYDDLVNIDMQTNIPEASACIQEAVICVNNEAYRGATVMARAALEVTLEYAGFNANMLVRKAMDAVNAEAISRYDRTRAENVRLIGNFGAHGSCARYVRDDAQMTQADAKYVVELSSELIKKLIVWRSANP